MVAALVLVGVAGIPPQSSQAVEPDSTTGLTLPQAVAHALSAGPAARIARLESERAAARAAAADSIYWPRASVSSQAGYSNRLSERLETVDAEGDVHKYGLGSLGSRDGWFNVMVHQVVFDLARWKQAERAQREAEVAALDEAQRRESTSYEVLEAYVNVLRYQELLDNQRRRISEVEALDQRAASLLDAGRSLAGERDEVALYLREVRLELLAREDQAQAARRALALLLGGNDSLARLRLGTDAFARLEALPADSDAAIVASPELRLLAMRKQIEELGLESVRAERYPVVALGGGYSHYGIYRYDNFPDEVRVGIDFELPLFEGFRRMHSTESAEKAVAAASVRYDALRDSKRARIDALIAGLDAAVRGAELLGERERLGHERIRLATLALDTQRGSVGVTLAARREVDAVIDASVAARFQPVLLRGQILREAGVLTTTLLGDNDVANNDA